MRVQRILVSAICALVAATDYSQGRNEGSSERVPGSPLFDTIPAPVPDFTPGVWFQGHLYVVGRRIVFFAAPDRCPIFSKVFDSTFESPPLTEAGSIKLLQEEANNAAGAKWDALLLRECGPDELTAVEGATTGGLPATLLDPRCGKGRILYENAFVTPDFGPARPIGGDWRIHDGVLECMNSQGWGVLDLGVNARNCVFSFRFYRRANPTTNWIGVALRSGKGNEIGNAALLSFQREGKALLRVPGHKPIEYVATGGSPLSRAVFVVPLAPDEATTPRLAILPVRNESARLGADRTAELIGSRLERALVAVERLQLVNRAARLR